jgi:hypothetical protein
MAEAVAAFSLAANVIQFIDFGTKVAANFYGFYKAGSRPQYEFSDLEVICQDLAPVLQNLQLAGSDSDVQGTGLGRLAQECQKCAERLNEKLQPVLKARSQQLGKREMLKVAFKAAWKDDEMRSLRDQLENFQRQLTLHLLASMRYALSLVPAC